MIGSTISHYRILEILGEGGMGIVYKAQDTKLDRFVALKFLPPQLNASEADKARFIQEAKAASALNHPNVCTIHDIQEHEGQLFIVMEFIDGQTLREKMATLSFKQAIEVGIQIADGLAAAHEQGIVHRDIKSDNIMIRKDGIAQIMDFGLAKLRGISRLTKEGSTLGTAGYMSPEQVQGLEVDHRSDIFSLGVVLYEMFTGQLPFKGVHETAISYEIVNIDAPPMSSIKPDIDPALDAIVLECLEKDVNERTQSAKQVSIDLKRFKRETSKTRVSRITQAHPVAQSPGILSREAQPSPTVSGKNQGSFIWIVTSIVFLLATVVVSLIHFRERAPERFAARFVIPPPENTRFQNVFVTNFAISPDGRTLAFVAEDSLGKNHLWIRPLHSLSAQLLPGTEDPEMPFWSPDNRFIGFFENDKLKKIEVSGGPPLTLCDATHCRGGTWNSLGLILFGVNGKPLQRVSSSGGVPTVASAHDTVRQDSNERFPCFLPDGNHFVYFAVARGGKVEENSIFLGSLDGSVDRMLLRAQSLAGYASGHLLYLSDQTLMAQPLDERTWTLSGDPFPVAEGVHSFSPVGSSMFSVSQNGILVYQMGFGGSASRLVWCDRSGKQIGAVGEAGAYNNLRISPDGHQVAADLLDTKSNNRDIWIYDLGRGIRTRFTFDPKDDRIPVWSPDGKQLVFASDRKAPMNIYRRASSGITPEELLLGGKGDVRPSDWSSDGKFILYWINDPRTDDDVWVLPLTGDQKPIPIVQTSFSEWNARFSPDGRWISYTSNESSQNEVYVVPFPGPGPKWQVSVGGGGYARWRRDGKEMYYRSLDAKIMAAEVNAGDGKFEVRNVHALFQTRFASGGNDSYDVTADGQKFLIITSSEGVAAPSLTVVINWDAEVKKK